MKKYWIICLATLLLGGCSEENNDMSLAETEALKYCACAKPIAQVTREMLAIKANYQHNEVDNEQKMSDLSRTRAQLTDEIDRCIADPKFKRYRDKQLKKMTSSEMKTYLNERVRAVMKHCPATAQTLDFGGQ